MYYSNKSVRAKVDIFTCGTQVLKHKLKNAQVPPPPISSGDFSSSFFIIQFDQVSTLHILSFFHLWWEKMLRYKKDDFDMQKACKAPICWLKYTTDSLTWRRWKRSKSSTFPLKAMLLPNKWKKWQYHNNNHKNNHFFELCCQRQFCPNTFCMPCRKKEWHKNVFV